MSSGPTSAGRWLWLLPFEIALFALVFWADGAGFVPLSITPFLFAIAWVSIVIRRQSWKAVGLRVDNRWARLLGIGIAAGAAFWALEYFVENPVLHTLTGVHPDLSDFRDIVGNLPLLLLFLGLNLVLAGFGEEMVWRGYALPRVAQSLGDTRLAWLAALVVVNVAFGAAHAYQGEAGVIQAGVQGVLLGVLYLATGRNLVAPIAAHVTANTCDFTLIYLGMHVGLGSAG